jgi:predicted nucleic acid-binding protein
MELSLRYSFGGRQVHDANIVATMLAHGERRLLTFNVADFRRFTPLVEVVTP